MGFGSWLRADGFRRRTMRPGSRPASAFLGVLGTRVRPQSTVDDAKSPIEPNEVNDCEVFAANGGTSPKAEGEGSARHRLTAD